MRGEMKSITPVATAILIAGLMTTTAMVSPADAAKIQEHKLQELTDVFADHTITPTERTVLSSAAVKALRHIAQARGDTEDGDRSAAGHQLDKAIVLLNIAEAALPTTIVRDRIWVARKHLEYEDTQEVLSDLVPIYSALDALTRYMPVEEARRHLDKAKESLGKKDKDKAISEFKAASAALDYSETDLPLRAARRLLAQARDEIQKANIEAAEDVLKAAENNVVFLSVAMHEPLAEAHRSLWRATRDYAAGAYDAAKSDVNHAALYLDYAISGTDEKTHKAIQALLEKARSQEWKIEAQSSEVPALLTGLWNRTKALSERSVEYFTTGWERLGGDGKLKANLIEAKLHLSYAEIDHFLDKDAKQAKSELSQAADYLAKAGAQARQDQAAEIEAVRNRVKEITSGQTQDQLKDQYAALKSRLGNLIESL